MNNIRKGVLGLLVGSALAVGAIPLASAQEHDTDFVCTAEQVLPGFGFLPITFSPEIAALFGVDPDECRTPIEP